MATFYLSKQEVFLPDIKQSHNILFDRSLDNLIHAAAVLMSFEQVPQILHNSYTNTYIVAITVAALAGCAVAPQ